MCVCDWGITQATHVSYKNSNIKGRSLNLINMIFHTIRNCSQSERIRSLWERILPFKRRSQFEKGYKLKIVIA